MSDNAQTMTASDRIAKTPALMANSIFSIFKKILQGNPILTIRPGKINPESRWRLAIFLEFTNI
jgi:hypothetical protein